MLILLNIILIFFFIPFRDEENLLNKAIDLKFNILYVDSQGDRVGMNLKNNTNKFITKIDYELMLYRFLESDCYIENVINRNLKISLKPGQLINNEIFIPSFPDRPSNSFRFLDVNIKKIYYSFDSNLDSNDLENPFNIP